MRPWVRQVYLLALVRQVYLLAWVRQVYLIAWVRQVYLLAWVSQVNHTGENINCHTQNIVYLLTCNECNIQHVGETIQPFNERMNGHRTSKVGCQHILDHKDVCIDHSYSYQVLEKLPGNGYDIYGHPDVQMRELRKSKEDSWIKTLKNTLSIRTERKTGWYHYRLDYC